MIRDLPCASDFVGGNSFPVRQFLLSSKTLDMAIESKVVDLCTDSGRCSFKYIQISWVVQGLFDTCDLCNKSSAIEAEAKFVC